MRKILIAAGGTGGHVFPAQALAQTLSQKGFEVLFVGGGLGSNRFFKKGLFLHREISSASFNVNIFKMIWANCKGIWQSLKIMGTFSPDAVIGFGSFYTFPVLCAARLKKVPLILFEPNAIPGKVNRLFSQWALFSAVQFPEAGKIMKGKSVPVKISTGERRRTAAEKAREYFYLEPDRFTFLVFGGSQGAQSINRVFPETIGGVEMDREKVQVIHVAGRADSVEAIRRKYEAEGIRSCVKVFEERMDLAWSAASLVVCRSGAATVAEQIAFEVPAIFIPFPYATDQHQAKNARFVQDQVFGALCCEEKELSVDRMRVMIQTMLDPVKLSAMQSSIAAFKKGEDKPDFCSLICEVIHEC